MPSIRARVIRVQDGYMDLYPIMDQKGRACGCGTTCGISSMGRALTGSDGTLRWPAQGSEKVGEELDIALPPAFGAALQRSFVVALVALLGGALLGHWLGTQLASASAREVLAIAGAIAGLIGAVFWQRRRASATSCALAFTHSHS